MGGGKILILIANRQVGHEISRIKFLNAIDAAAFSASIADGFSSFACFHPCSKAAFSQLFNFAFTVVLQNNFSCLNVSRISCNEPACATNDLLHTLWAAIYQSLTLLALSSRSILTVITFMSRNNG